MEPFAHPHRLVSLAAGTMLDVDPAGGVQVAADAGFGGAGLWFDPSTWTSAKTRAVAERLDATGLVALDLEPVILGRRADAGERMIDVAAELDVQFILVASGSVLPADVAVRLGTLAERAAATAPGLTLVLEFLPMFSVGSLPAAVALVESLAVTNVGVLIDALHLDRSGATPADLDAVPRRLLPYLQIADAPAQRPATMEALRDEALHGRLLPGEGVLPLADLLQRVPDVPLSMELRSRALLEAFPDPVERGRRVLASLSHPSLGRL